MRLLLFFFLTFNLLHAKKIALLMGNSTYAQKALKNPTHDVDLLSTKLKKLGFTVYTGKNLSRSKMIAKLRNFNRQVDSDTIALIYFSGHGVNSTLDDKNYLIPVGAFDMLMNETQLSDVAVSDSYLLGSTAGAKFSILLLDACRSNDFAQSRGDKGLGRPPSGLGNDYIVSYATSTGKTAADGKYNSPYALALSHHLLGHYSIEELFRRVRKEVATQTRGKQKPLYKPSFSEKLCLAGSCTQEPKVVDHSEELAKLKAENERLRRERQTKPKLVKYSSHLVSIGKLMYQNQPFTKRYTWSQAKGYCRDLTLGGYDDWRLPTRAEFNKLPNIKMYGENYDYDNWKKWFDKNKHKRLKGASNSHFVKEVFIDNMTMEYSWFWTSESIASSYAWGVSFHNGCDDWINKSSNFYALCVR